MIEHGETRQRRACGGGEAGGDPLESRWDEAERGQAAGVRDAGTEAEPDAGVIS